MISQSYYMVRYFRLKWLVNLVNLVSKSKSFNMISQSFNLVSKSKSFKMISQSYYMVRFFRLKWLVNLVNLVSNDRKYFAVDSVKLVEAAPSSAARKPFQELGERA